jgi:hypothetical protein
MAEAEDKIFAIASATARCSMPTCVLAPMPLTHSFIGAPRFLCTATNADAVEVFRVEFHGCGKYDRATVVMQDGSNSQLTSDAAAQRCLARMNRCSFGMMAFAEGFLNDQDG